MYACRKVKMLFSSSPEYVETATQNEQTIILGPEIEREEIGLKCWALEIVIDRVCQK